MDDCNIYTKEISFIEALCRYVEDNREGIVTQVIRQFIVNDHLKDIIDDDYIGNVRASTTAVGHNEIFAFCEAYVQFSDPVPRH